ncbi:hypothetical protein LPB248_06640 [Flavobacterium sp. LPB0248]|nr:hypothetical protein [Flavobacterium sp. LPB0248]QLC65966.1 hypothetical protein LPB248_06640 [Flavobacterium sp. LPB0248]
MGLLEGGLGLLHSVLFHDYLHDWQHPELEKDIWVVIFGQLVLDVGVQGI